MRTMTDRRAFALRMLSCATFAFPRIASAASLGGQSALDMARLLETYPYIAVGYGRPLYVRVHQSCGYCHAFVQDHANGIEGVQIRYIVPIYQSDDRNQVKRLFAARSYRNFLAYMNDTLPRMPGGIASHASALLEHAIGANMHMLPMLKQILGASGAGTPLFLARPPGHIFDGMLVTAGYNRDTVEALVSGLRQ